MDEAVMTGEVGGGSGRAQELLLGLRGARFVYFEPAPDRGADLVGQGVLDHGQVAGLDPLADQEVGHGQGEDAVGEVNRFQAGQPELPGALRHLVA
jgi:hypothetical protein